MHIQYYVAMHTPLLLLTDIQMAVVGTHAAHTTAKLAIEGEFTHARMNALVSQRLMQRTRYDGYPKWHILCSCRFELRLLLM